MRKYRSGKDFFDDGHRIADLHVEVAVLAPDLFVAVLVIHHRFDAFVVRPDVCGCPLQEPCWVFGGCVDHCEKEKAFLDKRRSTYGCHRSPEEVPVVMLPVVFEAANVTKNTVK